MIKIEKNGASVKIATGGGIAEIAQDIVETIFLLGDNINANFPGWGDSFKRTIATTILEHPELAPKEYITIDHEAMKNGGNANG